MTVDPKTTETIYVNLAMTVAVEIESGTPKRTIKKRAVDIANDVAKKDEKFFFTQKNITEINPEKRY